MCFNGAASARSRKCFKYPGGSLPCSMLQWGRERALAEMHLRDEAHRQRPGASMGPRARARVNEGWLVPGSLAQRKLQWGRERALAEMSRASGPSSRTTRLQWGRERALAELPEWCVKSGRSFELTWGRELALAEMRSKQPLRCLIGCFNGAASARSRKWGGQVKVVRSPEASMGPRARARGNLSRRTYMQPSGSGFNGAASARSRK